MGTMDLCAAVVEGICMVEGTMDLCMVPSERAEVGALGGVGLVGRLSDLDIDVAEVGWHVEIVAASDSW